jgi:hypothetical protein
MFRRAEIVHQRANSRGDFGLALRIEDPHAREAVQGRIASDSVARLLHGEALDRFGEDGIAVAYVDGSALLMWILPR